MSEERDRLDDHDTRITRLERMMVTQGELIMRLTVVVERLEASYARLETILTAIKELLERGNGH